MTPFQDATPLKLQHNSNKKIQHYFPNIHTENEQNSIAALN